MSGKYTSHIQFAEIERTNTFVKFKYKSETATIYKSWVHDFGGEVGEDSESLYFELTPHLKLVTVINQSLVEEILPFYSIEKAKTFYNELDADKISIIYTALLAILYKETEDE